MIAAEEWRSVVGQVFASWTILELPVGLKGQFTRAGKALCRCACGQEQRVLLENLLRGYSKQCRACADRKAHLTHGASDCGGKRSGDRLYRIWKAMKWRCNPNNKTKEAKFHAGRGIRVCEEWMHSYESFRDWALANGYRDDLTIDRWPDKNGNYELGNCRWAGYQPQARNTRRNIIITAFGETKPIWEWLDDPRCTVTYSALKARLRRGDSPEDAVGKPPRLSA